MRRMQDFGLWDHAAFGPLALLAPLIGSAVGAVGSAAAGVGSAVAGVGSSLLGGLGTAGAAGGAGAAAGAGAGAGGLLGGLSTAASLASTGMSIASLASGGPKVPKVDLGAGPYTPQPRAVQRNTSLAALSPGLSLAGTNGGGWSAPVGGGAKTLLGQ